MKNEFKGTKTKWIVDPYMDNVVICDVQRGNIAECHELHEGSNHLAYISDGTGWDNNPEEVKYNAQLIATAPELLDALLKIMATSEIVGREGCRYGDTEHDSISASHGYNECLSYIKVEIEQVVNKALGL